jgi:hypothetical protein
VIVFSLAVLRGSLLDERTIYPWGLVIAFVALSVAFNILHAPDDDLARVIAAVPPVALALAFELFTGQLKSEVTRRGVTLTLDDLVHQVAERRGELADLDQQAGKLADKVETLKAQIAELQREHQDLKRNQVNANGPIAKHPRKQTNEERLLNLDQANLTRQEQIALRQQRLAGMLDQEMTQGEMAKALGVSLTTVKRDLQVINEAAAVAHSDNGKAS